MADRYIEQCLVSNIGVKCGNDNLGTILLLIYIISMGLLYVVVKVVVTETNLGSLTYFACRYVVAVVLLSIINATTSFLQQPQPIPSKFWWDLLWWGTIGGIINICTFLALQYGEETQSVAQASFIMGMYVVIVPLAELILSKFSHWLPWRSWVAVALDIPGILLLSGCADSDCFNNFQWGLLWLVLAMMANVADTIVCARAIPVIGSMPMIFASNGFCAVFGLIMALSLEYDQWQYPYIEIRNNWYWIVITAVLGVVLSLTFTIALAFTSTSRVAILASMESVSGAACGFLILGENMTTSEDVGAALMMAAAMIELIPCECYKDGNSLELGHETEGDEVSEEVGLTPTESTPLMDVNVRRLSAPPS